MTANPRLNRYILHCLFEPQIAQYHRNLVNEIAETTGLRRTQRQGLAAHFTVKYHFETEEIEVVEKALDEFCKLQVAAPIQVAEVGAFAKRVVFLNVQLSRQAQDLFDRLMKTLREFKWMKWDPYDAENLHFHMTVAEDCGKQFNSALQIANSRAHQFNTWLDNVTILQMISVRDGIDLWEVHKVFRIPRNQ